MSLIRLCLVCLLLAVGAYAANILANSGYSMIGGNPQRNYQINKKFICPEIAPQRTQVWNIAWQVAPPGGSDFTYFSSFEMTQDDEGFLYVRGHYNSQPVILKFNSTDGSYDVDKMLVLASDGFSAPTHVQRNLMYVINDRFTVVVNTTTMQSITSVDIGPPGIVGGSYAPFGEDLMISARSTAFSDAGQLFFYLNTTSFEYVTNQPNSEGSNPLYVIVYKNSSNIEIPISVYGTYGQLVSVWSPNYQFTIDGSYFCSAAYVQEDRLIITYATPTFITYTLFYNPNTGALLNNISLATFKGSAVQSVVTARVFGSKSVAGIQGSFGAQIVDFLNSKVLLDNVQPYINPFYSNPDNSVLFSYQTSDYKPQQLVSFDWDTQMINAVGGYPTDGQYSDFFMTPPLVGDDCTIYTYYDDSNTYAGLLIAHKPLPISNVVPIAECVNADGVAYLSYNNFEDKHIIIPYAADRNNVEPMNVAGATDFRAKQRGKHFPLSEQVALSNNTSSFTWHLEDYVLSFSNTEQIRCPQNVTLLLSFSANSTVPDTFSDWISQQLVQLSYISESRVTVLSNQTQSATTFQIIVHIAATASDGEPTPEVAATEAFVSNIKTFKQLLSQSEYAAIISFEDVDGVPLSSEISGSTIPPPISQPIDEPAGQAPTSTNIPTSNNAPKGATSSGVQVLFSFLFFTAALFLCVV